MSVYFFYWILNSFVNTHKEQCILFMNRAVLYSLSIKMSEHFNAKAYIMPAYINS